MGGALFRRAGVSVDRRRSHVLRRKAWRSRGGGCVVFPILLLVAVACSRQGREGATVPPGTPIVLISIDTLRSDRLPAYGYREVATPALDALRQDSILFERAYCAVPLTLPSHATILTGLLPPDHGVRDNLGYHLKADKLPSLPRTLKELGYTTGAAVSAFVLRSATGIASSFDFYDDQIQMVSGTPLGNLQRPGGETLSQAFEWLESVHEQPFFLVFHIYEPHTPYDPPQPFASLYRSPYDGEVAASDQIIGRLLAALRRLEVYDRAIIILLSDHGEGLGDHGEQEHELFLYREVLQVPLMLKLPGSERGGSSVSQPAQLIDVFPTVLALLGADGPGDLPGRSLLDLERPDAPPRRVYSETFYPRLHFGWSDLASLIDYPYHFIEGPDPELYDLEKDPAETHNILRQKRRVYRLLKEELDSYDRSLRPPAEVDAETRQKLAALGYIGTVASDRSGPLPDPKSRLPTFNELRRAFRHFSERRFAEAVEAFRQVLAEEPRMVDAWEHLGKSLRHLGRFDEAAAAYRKALTLSGGAPHVALAAAELYLHTRRLDEAKTHAELALPSHEVAYDLLAQIALGQGDLNEAEHYVELAMATRGTRVGPLITKAQLLFEQGRLEDSIELTLRAEEEFGDRTDREVLRGLYLVRGDAYARLGEAGKAERALTQEIELSPSELAPFTHLAFLYALEGRSRDAGATLRRMVETNPTPAAYARAVRTLRAMGDPDSASALLRHARRRWPESLELRELAG